MLWNKKSAGLVWETLVDVKEKGNSSFLRMVAFLLDMYDNEHAAWMEGSGNLSPEDTLGAHTPYLEKYFPNAWANGSGYLQPFYLPFLRRLVDYVAALFHRRPSFYLTKDGDRIEPDHEQSKLLAKVAKQCGLTTKFRKAQRLAYLVKTVFLFPSWHFGKMKVEVLTPDLVWPWERDRAPGDVQQCEWISHELQRPMMAKVDAAERRFLLSSAPPRDWQGKIKNPQEPWKIQVVDYWGERIPGTAGTVFPGDVNPYRQHPYIVMHDRDFDEGMLAPLDGTMKTAAVGMDLLWTDYHLMMRQHGGVAVANLMNPDKWPLEIPMGPDRTINMGLEEKYGWVHPSYDIQGMISFAQAYMQTYAIHHGLSPDLFTIAGGSFKQAISAAAKEVDRIDVQEVREEAEPYYEDKITQEFWPLFRDIWNKWNPAERFDTTLDLGIDWPEPKQIVSPQERAQARAIEQKLGTFDPVRAIMQDEQVSEKEAERRFELALERSAKIRATSGEGAPRTSPDPDPDLESAEDDGQVSEDG